MQSLPSLSQHIPSQLTHSSLLASKAAVDFGETVEQILNAFKGESVDLVVSDGAPDILGDHDFDQFI